MPTFITRDYAVSQKRSYGTASPYWASIIGSLNGTPARDDAAMLQKHPGQLSKLRVSVEKSGNAGSATVTLWKKEPGEDWTDTDLAVTIPATQPGLYENISDVVTFSQGDLFCWEICSNTSGALPLSLRSIIVQVADQS